MSQLYSKKRIGYLAFGFSSITIVIAAQMPRAEAITFTGLSGNLAASADFQINGDTLTLKLTNISSQDVLAPSDLLTGVFFNASKSLSLQSATIGYGSTVYQNGNVVLTQPTDVSVGNLIGGWQYQSNISNSTLGNINQGLGTAGFGIFNGNLTGNGNQFDYGLLSASSNLTASANQPVQETSLIKNSLVFTFLGASGLTEASISNVLFQYGTNLSESRYAGLTLADATAAADAAAQAAQTTAQDAEKKATDETVAKETANKAATETATANAAAKSAKDAADKAAAETATANDAAKVAKDAADKAAQDAANKAAAEKAAKDAAEKAAQDAANKAADKEAKQKAAQKATGQEKAAANKAAQDAEKAAKEAEENAKATKQAAETASADKVKADTTAKTAKDAADAAAKVASEKATAEAAAKQATDAAAKVASDKAAAETAAKQAAEKASADKAAADAAAKAAADKAAKAAADKAAVEVAEKAAKEQAAKEAAEKAAAEKAAKEAAEKGNTGSTSSRPLPVLNFSLDDVGKTFLLNFDGNVSTQNVSGLTSTAWLTLTSFTGSEAFFDVSLDNTSSDGITSRTSGFGFNVYSDLGSTNKLDLVAANTKVSGLFDNSQLNGSFPNQFGDIDVCFTQGNTCQGGQNGGVNTNDPIQKFSFSLGFKDAVNSFALGNFGVRYQSIDGTTLGTSGTGKALTYSQVVAEEPQQVPEPGTTTALGLFVAGVFKLLKKKSL